MGHKHTCKKCFLKDLLKTDYEYRTLDGSGNNKKHEDYGKCTHYLQQV